MTMQTDTDASKVVVVGVDGTADGARALRFAVAEADRIGGFLRIVHVHPGGIPEPGSPRMPVRMGASWHEVAAQVVKDAEQQARQLGDTDPRLEAVLMAGTRKTVLLEQSAGAACVVLGARRAPWQHLVAGSTTTALAAHAQVPVIAVPRTWDPDDPHGKVVVGTDVTEVGPVVTVAFDAARARHAAVQVVSAWRPRPPYDDVGAFVDAWRLDVRSALTRAIEEAGIACGTEWHVSAPYAPALAALHQAGLRADLLVVGRHGHSAPHGLRIGSITRALIRTSTCPVMVVPTARRAD
jgi:nucleotide-binding universal stress UspA family protein